MKKNFIKKVTRCIGVSAVFAFIYTTSDIYGSVIHKHVTEHKIANGVTYEINRQVTSRGLLDIHVVRIDMEAPGITVGPAAPINYGTRHTTSGILADNGAIAGINADFFNMSASPVTPMGQVVQNGNIVSINQGEPGYATFFVDTENNPFIGYIRPEIIFLNNGIRNLSVQYINKYETEFSSAIFDRQAMADTTLLDENFQELVKVVVEDDIITYISHPGETVVIPENGYIIALSSRYYTYFTESISVGDTAEVKIEASVNFDEIYSAIGGAGTILENGTVSNTGYVVAPNARHPRSAVGINQNGTEVILVAVDGRRHSIGATHAEMSNIMLELGAFNALHLDGGGSTTMAVKTTSDDYVKVVNTISDTSQRRVVNALGVYNNSEPGVISSVTISTYPKQVFNGGSINVYPFGLDGHLNRVDLNWDNVTLTSDDTEGRWEGNTFYPSKTGDINFTLTYEDFSYTTTIQSYEIASIFTEHTQLDAVQGQVIPLNFRGISTMGHIFEVNGLNLELFPQNLGNIENNTLTVTGNESGYIKASIGNISTYINVNVNGQGSVPLPVTTNFTNPYSGNLQAPPNQDSFDITLVGNLTVSEDLKPDNYLEIQNNALTGFIQNSTKGIFVGNTDIEQIHGLQLARRTNGYRFTTYNNVALVNLDASKGTLTTTSVYNWSFVNEVKNSNADHIIIQMDRQPSSLSSDAERKVFEEALEELVLYGKNVFVVSTEGLNNTSTIINGVNYINLSGLFSHDGNVNNNFSILRFRVTGDNIQFEIQNVF